MAVENEKEEVAPEPPVQKSTRSRFNLIQGSIIKLEERASAVASILFKVLLLFLLIVAIVFIYKELSDTSYSIKEINVPVSYSDAGYTGAEVANRISDRLKKIIARLNSQEFAQGYTNSRDREDISVDMVGMGVPVRAFIGMMGDALGIRRVRRISATIAENDDSTVVLVLRVSRWPDEEHVIGTFGKKRNEVVNEISNEAALTVLKYTDPLLLQRYYSDLKLDGRKTIEVSRFIFENYPDNKSMIAGAYVGWSGGLRLLGKLDEADVRLAEGLEKFPGQQNLLGVKAYLRMDQGKYTESLEMFKQLERMQTTKAGKINLNNNIGNNFWFLNQPDSALAYYKKCVDADKDFINGYYNSSLVYLRQRDTTRFYEFIETAFKKGLDAESLFSDPDMVPMKGQVRLEKLRQQYLVH